MSVYHHDESFDLKTEAVGIPLLFALLLWLVFWFEVRFGFDFNTWGIYPRSLFGLRGIVFSPFIHGDMSHLWNNTPPVLILTASLFYFYQKIAWKVLLWGALFTGIGTWVLGRSSYHIGASGIIYMLFGFLFFKGILAKHFRLIAVSFFVVFLYGSMVWYAAPTDPKISWEGHLSGLVVGTVFALIFRRNIAKPPAFDWQHSEYDEEEDEFMQQFDENGNFSPKPPPDSDFSEIDVEFEEYPGREESPDEIHSCTHLTSSPRITYIYKESKPDSPGEEETSGS